MTRLAPLLLLLAGCSSTVEGHPHAPVTVLFFITTDCPIANSFAPEIHRIIEDYQAREAHFALIYTDLSKTLEDAQQHAAEYGYQVQVGTDRDRRLCRRYGITTTPEAVVLDWFQNRVYRGRIDDRYLAPGQYRLKPTTRELRDAIEAVLDRRPVAVPETKAVGCPWTE